LSKPKKRGDPLSPNPGIERAICWIARSVETVNWGSPGRDGRQEKTTSPRRKWGKRRGGKKYDDYEISAFSVQTRPQGGRKPKPRRCMERGFGVVTQQKRGESRSLQKKRAKREVFVGENFVNAKVGDWVRGTQKEPRKRHLWPEGETKYNSGGPSQR